MAGPRVGAGRWSVVVSLAVAAAMATMALITVEKAGCDEPGQYVATSGGWELVGGCVEPNDLTVAPDTANAPPAPSSDANPVRP